MVGDVPPLRPESSVARLSPGWSRTLFVAWGGVALALVCVGFSSHIIGRPVFWLDDQRWPLVVLVLLAALTAGPIVFAMVWAYANGPYFALISCTATCVLVGAAVADRNNSPGAAVVEAALATSGILLSIAAFAVRSHRHT